MKAIEDEDTIIISIISMAGMGKTTLAGKVLSGITDRTVDWTTLNEWTGVERTLTTWSRHLAMTGRGSLFDGMAPENIGDLPRMVDLLARDTDSTNVLFVLDDHHRTGGAIDPLLSAILERKPKKALKLLLCSRERPKFYGNADLLTGNRIVEVCLDVLDRDSALEMLDEHGIPPQDQQRILNISRGHPLAMEMAIQAYRKHPEGIGEEVLDYVSRELISDIDMEEREILFLASSYERPVVPDGLMLTGGASRDLLDSLRSRLLLRTYPDGRMDIHDLLREDIRKWMNNADRKRFTDLALTHLERRGSGRDLVHLLTILDREGRKKEMDRVILDNGEFLMEWGDPHILDHIRNMDDLEGSDRISYLTLRVDMEISRKRTKKAMRFIKEALEDSGQADQRQISRLYTLKAEVSGMEGRTREVLEVHRENVRRMREGGSRSQIGKALNNLGKAYMSIGDLDRAMINLRESSLIFDEEDDNISRALVQANMARIHVMKKDNASAEEILSRIDKERIRSASLETRLRSRTGRTRAMMGQGDLAIRDLRKAYDLAMELGDRRRASMIICDMAGIFHDTGNRKKAISCLMGMETILDPLGPTDHLLYYLDRLSTIPVTNEKIRNVTERAIRILMDKEDIRELARKMGRYRKVPGVQTEMIYGTTIRLLEERGLSYPSVIIGIWMGEIMMDRENGKRILNRARKRAERVGFKKALKTIDDIRNQ